jgi:hypothetical protein
MRSMQAVGRQAWSTLSVTTAPHTAHMFECLERSKGMRSKTGLCVGLPDIPINSRAGLGGLPSLLLHVQGKEKYRESRVKHAHRPAGPLFGGDRG